MIKLKEKEYDLNFICNFTLDFQMLKDILLQLVQSNQDLENRVQNLEKSNKEKNIIDSEQNEENRKNKEIIEEKNELEKEEEKEVEIDQNEESENEIKPIGKIEFKKEKEKKKEIDKEVTEEKITRTKIALERRKSLKEYESRNSLVQAPQVSHETIKSLLKLIRENSEKISKLEKNFSKKLNKKLDNLEKDLNDLYKQNTQEHEKLEEKIRVLNDRLYESNNKLDGLIVKTAPFDTMTIFRDSGNGDIDSTKAMIKFSEDKIYKKINLMENRINKDSKNEEENKNKLVKLEEIINQINNELSKKEEMKENDEEKIIKHYDENIKELKNLIDIKYNDLLNKIDDLYSKMKNGELVGEQVTELINQIKYEQELNLSKSIESTNQKRNSMKDNINLDIKTDIRDDENTSNLKEHIKAVNNKINSNYSYFRALFDKSNVKFIEIKKKLEEIATKLDTKITMNALKSLENKNAEQDDEINYLQDKVGEILQGYKKLSENNSSYIKRIEVVTNDIINLKKREIKEVIVKPIDMSKYVEEKKLNEILKSIEKSFETLSFDKEDILNKIKETNDSCMILFEKKEKVMKLEEEINEKINDLTNEVNKKFLEKSEMNKIVKNTELKLKLLENQQSNRDNKDSESWILAKQPIGCFNCASCEANIRNVSPSNEFLSWNKYPQAERQYNMGQGFSRLLQKLNGNINNTNRRNFYERKEISSETELNSSVNLSNITKNNGHFFFKMNKREVINDNINDFGFKFSKKYKLPNVTDKKKRNEDIPLTDEENEKFNNSMDNTENLSPSIMKIAKKNLNGDLFIFKMKQKKQIKEKDNIINSNSVKSNNKLERNKSLPIYENIN